MRQWTDTELMQEFADSSVEVNGKQCVSLADIERIVFDPRFPKERSSLAVVMLQLMHQELKNRP